MEQKNSSTPEGYHFSNRDSFPLQDKLTNWTYIRVFPVKKQTTAQTNSKRLILHANYKSSNVFPLYTQRSI